MITIINQSKALIKHMSCKCKCKFDDRKCNLTHQWNNDKCRYECKIWKKIIFGILVHVLVKIVNI